MKKHRYIPPKRTLRSVWKRLKFKFHPNRLRQCKTCHTRGHIYFENGECYDCWLPF